MDEPTLSLLIAPTKAAILRKFASSTDSAFGLCAFYNGIRQVSFL